MTLYMTLKKTLLKHPKFFDPQKLDLAFFEQLQKECIAFEDGCEELFEIGYGDWTVGYLGKVLDDFDEVIGTWSCIKSVMEDFESFEEMYQHYYKKFRDQVISLGSCLVLFNNAT